MAGKIGVLALQGAFAKHEQMLEKLGRQTLQIRYPEELKHCSGLIIPGGESTTLTHQIKAMHFLAPLKEFANSHPIFGTCAGLILMAREGILSLLECSVARNAYGRQLASFSAPLSLNFSAQPFDALFIRAPRLSKIHAKSVKVLAKHEGEAVLIQQGFHLASSFHPELTQDLRIHQYFCDLCKC